MYQLGAVSEAKEDMKDMEGQGFLVFLLSTVDIAAGIDIILPVFRTSA